MGRTESIRHVGEFTIVNSWSRTRYRTTEKSELFYKGDWEPITFGYYYRINRPRQRYDYESSFRDACYNLLNVISWSQYEAMKPSIDELKKAIETMENYGGTPRN